MEAKRREVTETVAVNRARLYGEPGGRLCRAAVEALCAVHTSAEGWLDPRFYLPAFLAELARRGVEVFA